MQPAGEKPPLYTMQGKLLHKKRILKSASAVLK
jgi:hypothetical protein